MLSKYTCYDCIILCLIRKKLLKENFLYKLIFLLKNKQYIAKIIFYPCK